MSLVHDQSIPDPTRCAPLVPEQHALMADPAEFDVLYAINPHMRPGTVDRSRARSQWETLRSALTDLGLQVHVVPAAEGLPDLVFTANQSFPVRDGSNRVLLSRMAAHQRQPEVGHVDRFWRQLGCSTEPLEGEAGFEAGGDALWFPGRRLILCGVGPRTHRPALTALAEQTGAPVVALRLQSPDFYHLDTCLCPLDERCALYAEGAFSEQDVSRLYALFPESVRIPREEALATFACNGAVVRGHYLVHPGAPTAERAARQRGLVVRHIDTSEFLKSGGSVTCLHLRF